LFRVYVDSLFLVFGGTFILDALALWAIRQILRLRSTRSRLLGGAAVSATVFVVVVALSDIGLFNITSTISLGLAILLTAVSIRIAFPGTPLKIMASALFHRYLLTVMAGGAGVVARAATGGNPLVSFLAAVSTILLVAEAGWGAVHRGIRDGLFFVPVSIFFGSGAVSVWALIDTGNRLRDPLSGNPVIIVEYSAIEGVLPPDIREPVRNSGSDFSTAAAAIAESGWSARFRAVPYTSIGQERGLLVGFRPDEVRVSEGNREISTRHAVVCVHSARLCSDGKYRALLNPDILTTA
jgi:stage II sporulation protein GA (sporulation sigma-E factor processing peptidase)